MRTLRMKIMVEVDTACLDLDNPEDREWFWSDYLNPKGLLLHSNAIGDTVGPVTVLSVDDWGVAE